MFKVENDDQLRKRALIYWIVTGFYLLMVFVQRQGLSFLTVMIPVFQGFLLVYTVYILTLLLLNRQVWKK